MIICLLSGRLGCAAVRGHFICENLCYQCQYFCWNRRVRIFLQYVHTVEFGAHFSGKTIVSPCGSRACRVEFGAHFAGKTIIPGLLSKSSPALLERNDCALVTGDKLLQTFDYLEVAEFSAKSLIMAASLGNMVPINDEQVEELRMAFLK